MNCSSTHKILLLLSFLINKPYSKKEIIDEFEKFGFKINKPTINSYIKKLASGGFEIKIEKQNRENIYSLVNKDINLRITKNELNVLEDIKKLLLIQSDYNKIRVFMRLFYKFALLTPDKQTKERLLYFDYYSKLNWYLVRQLEQHAKQKDIIVLEYVLPQGKIKDIVIHADYLKVSQNKNRLYLYGIIENTNTISHLPLDRIYRVKKVLRRKTRFNLLADTFIYIVSKDAADKIGIDRNETIVKTEGNYVHIERIKDDNFSLIQRLLYFCPDLYYISDIEIRNKVKEKLEIMKDVYDQRIDP